ncbi:hypothetical protein COY87_01950 [Candidatus Roizmanbacteria bacterium CG_4_10_14_0_8_um_filter_33_9]|uniref:Type II secretion system protein GspH n=1 Tax=Candidatus Roizmanbacteria bacterium CG_4_10_14_0_8_um_filter_33_9 TaxID=1974826 RepID=A0A2M7QIU4_9BACT|nr:MAG: hypothetical protein COY87_01950 [Candidatus Roizmanbacteria bacterium CG_4_10_14_0_8_um_filter_33_9]
MKSSSLKGFTLIELIVVIVIIAIFSTISLSTINRFTNEKQLKNETKKVMTILELTKSKTNSGDRSLCTPFNESSVPEVQDFTFQVDVAGKSYQIIPHCIESDPQSITYAVSNNIYIYPNSIDFNPNYGKVTCTCFVVKSEILDKCNYIKVSANSIISDGFCSTCSNCVTNCTCP